MASLTIENYVKAIYQLTLAEPEAAASTGAIASVLQVSPSSVTSMLKTLHEQGIADHRRYEGVRLTEKGVKLALRVLRRHRLVELFLVRTLNFSWDEVHAEAENMEHAVSDLLVDRIDSFLGFPACDPHGDPIPRADGSHSVSPGVPLLQCQAGSTCHLHRVLDQKPEFLRFLSDSQLEIGCQLAILQNDSVAGTITVQVAEQRTILGYEAARQIMVELV
ncbi:MAG: metal-dependent transcriptional regulator [Planctomycetales bacterium]|nr:metal-dependent transcriptional regulator [Planctomycetales bacterium]